jgi:hypothetical protein
MRRKPIGYGLDVIVHKHHDVTGGVIKGNVSRVRRTAVLDGEILNRVLCEADVLFHHFAGVIGAAVRNDDQLKLVLRITLRTKRRKSDA